MNEPFAKLFVGALFSLLLSLVILFSYFVSSSHLIEASSARLVLQQMELSAEDGGKIKESFVKEGTFVKEGSTLFCLDDTHLQAKKREELTSLKHAEDQVELATMRMQRLMETYLEKKREVTIDPANEEVLKQVLYELQEAQIALEAASSLVEWKECKLKTLDEELARKRIVAPIDGIIGEVRVNRGAVVTPGQPFVILYQPKQSFIYAFIKEREAKNLSLGAEATVFLPSYPHLRCKGELLFISPEVNSEGQVPVKISFNPPIEILKSNLSAHVIINKRKA